jgi:histidine triad (HIT) family protein
MQADCTFCQIVSGELPADLVDEDERTVAFMDISPATHGHVLVVPRRHVADVMSAGTEDWLAVAATARRMARWVVGAFRAGGVDLVQANSDGSVGNQTVYHLHVHVLPRYHDDQLGAWWSPETADPAEITEAARLHGDLRSRAAKGGCRLGLWGWGVARAPDAGNDRTRCRLGL